MKVILNQDVPNLGEMGDIKVVANGYARNFLLPRGFVLPHNAKTVALFEKRREEIAALKEEKRKASAGLKERIEAEDLSLTMPAGANGKLFGAVTSQTIADELLKKGVQVDRKKIDVPDRQIKSAGNFKIAIHLYEKEQAVLRLSIVGQDTHKKQEAPAPVEKKARHQKEAASSDAEAVKE